MRRLACLIFLMSLAVASFGQSRHPLTIEDMMKLKRVGEPEVSPDGKWVIFSVVDVDLAANTKTPHIWIVPVAGGPEREIIASQNATRPRWAPDGKRFAFISDKGDGSQVWVAHFDGAAGTVTDLHELTSIATGAYGELWSPDGKSILFVSTVFPECADEACNVKRLAEISASKVKAMIFTRLLYRESNAYKEGMRSHIFVVSLDACGATSAPACHVGAARDLTPGDYDAPVFSGGGQDNYAFSPDGQEVCYASNHDKTEGASTNTDLWIVPVTGGPAKNITAENPASDSTPLYSPDGQYIAYLYQKRPGYESDRSGLALYDRKTREKINLTGDFDRWVGTFIWARNSKDLYFVTDNAGASPIYSLSLKHSRNGIATLVAPRVGGYNDDLAITRDGSVLLFTRQSMLAPKELYAANTRIVGERCLTVGEGTNNCAALKESALTHLNALALSQVSMSPLESFWFMGAHGDMVEGFLVKPPNFDASRKYPVKFWLKGGPQLGWGDRWSYSSNLELFAADGYVVITMNFHGSTGYGQKFTDAVVGDWGGAPFEDEMKGLDYAEKTYSFIDKDRECAIGSSYGGYMANWILGHTDRFKCIVSHHAPFNMESMWGSTDEQWFIEWDFKGTPFSNRALYQRLSPHLYAENFKTPTLVIYGQRDYKVDVSQGFELFTTLQRLGVPSKMLYYPDEAQYPSKPLNTQLWYKTIDDWVGQWTKK
jgi:dipeptidyl aminopeptidase/acylaminoacyl peptidase